MRMSSQSPSEFAPATGLVQLIRRHQLVAFFVIAYTVTWLVWSPVVLLGLSPFNPATNAPSLYMMPAIAIGVSGTAFVLTALTQGRAGVRRLMERLTWWRVGPQWYAVAALLIPLAGLVVAFVLGSADAFNSLAPAALLLYPAAYLAHFFFGPLFEESGWRGFALPRMQHRWGPLRGTLLLGLLWSAWHFFVYVPLWFAGGDVMNGVVALGTFTLWTTAMTFIFTWLFNNTQASLLLSILLHGSVDGSVTYFQVLADRAIISADTAASITGAGMMFACIIVAVLLVAVTRGKLSYPRYQHEAEPLDLAPTMEQHPAPGARH